MFTKNIRGFEDHSICGVFCWRREMFYRTVYWCGRLPTKKERCFTEQRIHVVGFWRRIKDVFKTNNICFLVGDRIKIRRYSDCWNCIKRLCHSLQDNITIMASQPQVPLIRKTEIQYISLINCVLLTKLDSEKAVILY